LLDLQVIPTYSHNGKPWNLESKKYLHHPISAISRSERFRYISISSSLSMATNKKDQKSIPWGR
jgi:hypothetical protein